MSDPLFDPMRAEPPAGADHEPWTLYVDPTQAQAHERERWEARAAQWRARALAEAVFGGEVEARLAGQLRGAAPTGFRGLLHLEVPFRDLGEHQARERVFLAAAGADPVLARVPFVFVLGPRATAAAGRGVR